MPSSTKEFFQLSTGIGMSPHCLVVIIWLSFIVLDAWMIASVWTWFLRWLMVVGYEVEVSGECACEGIESGGGD
jgi:hypothetical protein